MIDFIKKLIFSYTAKNVYWITIGNISIIVTGFVFTVFIARLLSPAEFGLFATVTSLIFILSDLGDLGLGGGLTNFIPSFLIRKDKINFNKFVKTAFIFQLVIAFIIGLSLVLFSSPISGFLFKSTNYSYRLLIYLSSLGIFIYILANFFSNLLIAKEEFKNNFIILNLFSFPRLILLLIFSLLLFRLNILTVLLIFISNALIGLIGCLFFTPFEFLKMPDFYPLKKIFNFSIFLAMNKLFVSLFSRLDIIMLTALSTAYNAGIYSAASRIAFLYPLIGGSIGTVISPKYAKLSQSESIRFTKKVFLLIFFLIISLIFLVILAPVVINIVYGTMYEESIPILRILLIATIPFLLAIPTNNLLTYNFKKPHIIAISSLIQLLIIFFGNLSLIPILGEFAPAISVGFAALISMLLSFLSVVYYLRKE